MWKVKRMNPARIAVLAAGQVCPCRSSGEQTETLARSRQMGTLALRSIADVNMVETTDEDGRQRARRGESVNVVRYGIARSTTMQK